MGTRIIQTPKQFLSIVRRKKRALKAEVEAVTWRYDKRGTAHFFFIWSIGEEIISENVTLYI